MMPYKITSLLKNIKAVSDTDMGVEYYNGLFDTTDCVVAWEEPLTPEATEAQEYVNMVAGAISTIDADTDAIYGAVLGNRGPEYLDAEIAAQAYKDAGYTGTVPEDVQSHAAPKGWAAQQAADDILLTAANWRPAKSAIRANRMAAKEAVRDSLTISEVEAVLAWWAIFVVTIRGQLGV